MQPWSQNITFPLKTLHSLQNQLSHSFNLPQEHNSYCFINQIKECNSGALALS